MSDEEAGDVSHTQQNRATRMDLEKVTDVVEEKELDSARGSVCS